MATGPVVRGEGGRDGRQGVIGMMSRRTARAVLPPLFALGLTAFVVRPIDAPVVHAAPVQVTHGTASYATSSAAAALVAQADSGSAQSVSVEVPAVVFTDRAVANAGRLHVPVLLTDPTVTARASVESDPTCGVDLVQGVTGWVDCAISTRTLLVVHLSDGRSFAQVVGVG